MSPTTYQKYHQIFIVDRNSKDRGGLWTDGGVGKSYYPWILGTLDNYNDGKIYPNYGDTGEWKNDTSWGVSEYRGNRIDIENAWKISGKNGKDHWGIFKTGSPTTATSAFGTRVGGYSLMPSIEHIRGFHVKWYNYHDSKHTLFVRKIGVGFRTRSGAQKIWSTSTQRKFKGPGMIEHYFSSSDLTAMRRDNLVLDSFWCQVSSESSGVLDNTSEVAVGGFGLSWETCSPTLSGSPYAWAVGRYRNSSECGEEYDINYQSRP